MAKLQELVTKKATSTYNDNNILKNIWDFVIKIMIISFIFLFNYQN